MDRRTSPLRSRAVVLLLTCAIVAGCSASVAKLDATVTINGAAVADAEVVIEPESSGKGSYFGLTRADGTCAFDLGGRTGLPPGKYRFLITRYETADGSPVPTGEEGQVMKQGGKAVRRVYLLQRELAPGKNSLALGLESAKEQVDEQAAPAQSI